MLLLLRRQKRASLRGYETVADGGGAEHELGKYEDEGEEGAGREEEYVVSFASAHASTS